MTTDYLQLSSNAMISVVIQPIAGLPAQVLSVVQAIMQVRLSTTLRQSPTRLSNVPAL